MKTSYLFPSKYKKIGWWIFIPSSIIGLITLFLDYTPDVLSFNVPDVFHDGLIGMVKDNILNEILGVLIITSALLVAFSKEKTEDEYYSRIRLESLVWAVYVHYGVLLISFLLFHNFTFLLFMEINMFTVLLFFIIRFNWQISKLKKSANHE